MKYSIINSGNVEYVGQYTPALFTTKVNALGVNASLKDAPEVMDFGDVKVLPVSHTPLEPNKYQTVSTAYEVGESSVTATDTLTDMSLEDAKASAIADMKASAGDEILEAAPDYKQRNAALGILTTEEIDTIKTAIEATRTKCDAKEAAIAACTTADELIAITWQ